MATTPTASEIISWAKKQQGKHLWDGKCQAFVADAYSVGGKYTRNSKLTATLAYKAWCKSTSKTNVPTGAAVYFNGSGISGHVGIYIGNGQYIHAAGSKGVIISKLSSASGYRGWGYNGNVVPRGSVNTSSSSSSSTAKSTSSAISKLTGKTSSVTKTGGDVYLGNYKISFYCPCSKCCGKSDGITASGKKATEGRTIAVDTSTIALGSNVYIDGIGWRVAEDKGGAIKGNRIDVFVSSHQKALNSGVQYKDVWLRTGSATDVITEEETETTKEITSISVKSTQGKTGTRATTDLGTDAAKILGNGIEILIQNDKIYNPVVEGEITLTFERKGSPSTLKFNVVKDEILNIQEGNPVSMKVNGTGIFYGYIFKKGRSEKEIITITCYDQLRYLKNKDTYVYSGKSYTQLLKMIADDYKLTCGTLADTNYVLPDRIEENTLLDILLNASDLTVLNTGNLFVLYDDFGKLRLTNINDMKLPILIDGDTASEYSYESSIDKNVYNRIKLAYDNTETGEREVYIANGENSQKNWGILQYYEKGQESNSATLKEKAKVMLNYYNRKQRTLNVNKCFGDIRVRGGSSLVVNMNLGDMEVKNYMVVEKVTHRFSNGEHFMDLSLSGIRGEFNV